MSTLQLIKKRGILIGKKEGISIGKQEGISIGKQEVVVNGFKKGYDFSTLADITGLSVRKIKDILKKNNLL